MKKLTCNDIRIHREQFWKKTNYEQSVFINSEIRTVFKYQEEGASEVVFTVDGSSLCSRCWCLVYKVSRSRYYSHQRAVKSVLPIPQDKRSGQTYDSRRYILARLWMKKFTKRYGDRMPHKMEVQLPSCMTKTHVFNMYKKEQDDLGKIPIGRSRFLELWRTEFFTVKILKSKDFTKCSQCVLFQDALGKKLSKEKLQQVQSQREAHLMLQRILREKYYKHCEKAKDKPRKYLSIIIDNMDQNKTNLPVFPEQSKTDAGLTHAKHQITGVLDHGHLESHAYIWNSTMSGDSNITCSVLLDVLSKVAEKYDGHLPETLYLQCDNSRKDNKNQTVFNFLAALVKKKIFKKVKVSFLMVGHTHEDVDQLFSTISQALHRQPAPTIPALEDVIRSAYTPTPDVATLKNVWDVRALVQNEDTFKGHADPHVFILKMNGDDVVLKYKDWPVEGEQYRTVSLSARAEFEDLIPVQANVTEGNILLNAMMADLPKWIRSTRLSIEDAEWWRTYLPSILDTDQPTAHPRDLKHYLQIEEQEFCPQAVTEALAREEGRRQKKSMVTVSKRRRT